jgi:hypothetical protein
VVLFAAGRATDLLAVELRGACSQTALAALKASLFGAADDFWIAIGNSFQEPDPQAKQEILRAAQEELSEAIQLAKEQYQARLDLCALLGQAPYDPDIDPANFIDFEAVIAGEEDFTPNRYFPLVPGTTWEYLGFDAEGEIVERILVEVLMETKEILGVNCIVIRDRVWEIDEEGAETLIEDTKDWHPHDLAGNVWYFGEIAQEFEDGDLVSIAGSWQAGRDDARPGIIMFADPRPGVAYRQEFLLNEAEDWAKVVSRGKISVSVVFGDFTDDVLVTKDATPLLPGTVEFKAYAPGVGLILEVNPETGERVELVNMTVPPSPE